MKVDSAREAIAEEHNRAIAKFPVFNSPHEGFAVILEELDELKAEVWKNHKDRNIETLRKEAMQIAAMALRFMVDLT